MSLMIDSVMAQISESDQNRIAESVEQGHDETAIMTVMYLFPDMSRDVAAEVADTIFARNRGLYARTY